MDKKTVLALDYGKKRIGVATGNADFGIAFPRFVIENKGITAVIEKVLSLCDEYQVFMIVIGLPLNMEQEQRENEIMVEVEKFVSELKKHIPNDIRIELFDERLSTFEADKLMGEANESAGRVKLGRDAFAAQIILQRFFDNTGKK